MGNYRVFRLSQYEYRHAFDGLHAAFDDPSDRSFDELSHALYARGGVYSDAFSRAMRRLGNESMDLVYNAELVQKAWAREHGVPYTERRWMRDIFFAQLEHYRPDVIYLQGVNKCWAAPMLTSEFRERFPFLRVLSGYSGNKVSEGTREGLRHFDLVATGLPSFHQTYLNHGIASLLQYHAFDHQILDMPSWRRMMLALGEAVAFSFSGSTGCGWGDAHIQRYWELFELLATTELQMWAYERQDVAPFSAQDEAVRRWGAFLQQRVSDGGVGPDEIAFLRKRQLSELASDAPLVPLCALFPQRCRQAIYGLEMLELLARSRVTLNRHTDHAEGLVGNMRLFEATGVGSCLVTDRGRNLSDLFEADHEVVVYSSAEECREKVRYLLDHEADRRAIAEAGQRRILKDHTIQRRCEVLHKQFERLLSQRPKGVVK